MIIIIIINIITIFKAVIIHCMTRIKLQAVSFFS